MTEWFLIGVSCVIFSFLLGLIVGHTDAREEQDQLREKLDAVMVENEYLRDNLKRTGIPLATHIISLDDWTRVLREDAENP